MNFIEKILTAISNFMDFISDLFLSFIDFLAKPLSYLLAFLEGIFYFITKIFEVVIHVIMLFIALFQYLFAIVTGLFRTIANWVGFSPNTSYNLPSASREGFTTALDQIGGTGLLTVVPSILIAVLWLFFAIKVVALFGNRGSVESK